MADALDVFSLGPEFDLDELKSAYRSVALRVHPDRGGSGDLFMTVNECFRVLCLEHNSRSGGGLHDQLKRDFDADVRTYDATGRKDVEFDITRFNEVFDSTRVDDETKDSGYGKWLGSGEGMGSGHVRPKLNPNSGADAFNTAFEKSVPLPEASETAIIVRPLDASGGSSLWLTELGGGRVDDYSMDSAFDCRIAHSTQRLAPASSRPPPVSSAATPERIAASRAEDLAKGLTEREAEVLAREERRQAMLESARREREMQKHARMADAHARANRMFLGYR